MRPREPRRMKDSKIGLAGYADLYRRRPLQIDRAQRDMPAPPRDGHAHHWIIAPLDGPTVAGRCRTCGEEREFVTAYRAGG